MSVSTWSDLESLLAPSVAADLRVAFLSGALGGFVAYGAGQAVGCCTFSVSLLGVEPLRGMATLPVFTVLPGRDGAERALLRAALAGMKKARPRDPRRSGGLALPVAGSPGGTARADGAESGSRLRLVVR